MNKTPLRILYCVVFVILVLSCGALAEDNRSVKSIEVKMMGIPNSYDYGIYYEDLDNSVGYEIGMRGMTDPSEKIVSASFKLSGFYIKQEAILSKNGIRAGNSDLGFYGSKKLFGSIFSGNELTITSNSSNTYSQLQSTIDIEPSTKFKLQFGVRYYYHSPLPWFTTYWKYEYVSGVKISF